MQLNIDKVKIEDISTISLHLLEYFSNANKTIGADYYNTDKDIFERVVSDRINANNEFQYLVAKDEYGILQGFVGYWIHEKRKRAEIQIVWAKNNDKNTLENLIQNASENIKSQGINMIAVEVASQDTTYTEVLESRGAKEIGKQMLIQL